MEWLERTCPICGKQRCITNAEGYIYKKKLKTGMLWFCGWNCMRTWEKENPEPKPKEWWEE